MLLKIPIAKANQTIKIRTALAEQVKKKYMGCFCGKNNNDNNANVNLQL